MLPHLSGVPHLHVNRPLDWQNKFTRASRFFVYFFAVVARLRRENAQFHVLTFCRGRENKTTISFSFSRIMRIPLEFNSKEVCRRRRHCLNSLLLRQKQILQVPFTHK